MTLARLVWLVVCGALGLFLTACASSFPQPTPTPPPNPPQATQPTNRPAALARKTLSPWLYGTVTLAWEYPPEELAPEISFNVYEGNGPTIPLAFWKQVANTTNLFQTLQVIPGMHLYYVTATNSLEGLESPPSPSISRPPILPQNTRIGIP